MHYEVIKSYILAILVGFSLLLTFSLWNYQPNYEPLFDADYQDVIDLGGKVLSKKEIVGPSTMVFKRNQNYYGFTNPVNRQSLYNDIQSWLLYDFSVGEADGPPNGEYQVELVFPEKLPLEIVPSLFMLNEEIETFPTWSFQRMYITLNPNETLLTIHFLSVDGKHQARAVVNNATKYDLVKNHIMNLEGMAEYIAFDNSETPIYIPKNPDHMLKRELTFHKTDPNLLVSALFSSPSSVRRNYFSNVNETYYSDGQRGMSVYQDKRSMEYVNPYQTPYEYIDPLHLLERSMMDLNEYKGLSTDYNLDAIDTGKNMVRYRMHYGGYPVFNANNLSIIEQYWRNQELYKYIRPLYSFNNTVRGEEVDLLLSGPAIKTMVKQHPNYKAENIKDIQVGYRMYFQDTEAYAELLILEPAWYMKDKDGKWHEISPGETILDGDVS